jgi:hypothetical protein
MEQLSAVPPSPPHTPASVVSGEVCSSRLASHHAAPDFASPHLRRYRVAGGHGGVPQGTVDAVVVAAEVIMAIQTMSVEAVPPPFPERPLGTHGLSLQRCVCLP